MGSDSVTQPEGTRNFLLQPGESWVLPGFTLALAQGEAPVRLAVTDHNGDVPWLDYRQDDPQRANMVTRKPKTLTSLRGGG